MKRLISILVILGLLVQVNAQALLTEGGFRITGATAGQTVKWNGSVWTPANDLDGTSIGTVADSTAFRAFTHTTVPKVVIMTDSIRGGIFEQTTTETADQRMVFTDALGYRWTRLFDKKTVNIRWFGAIPDDGITDSLAVQLALNSPYDVFFPPGTYLTGQHTLTIPKTITGRNAIWQLRTGLSTNTRMLTIMSNNVVVEGLSFIGKIAVQTSEFSHGLTVGKPISDISAIGFNNVILRNLRFTDIRGDGIMVTASGLAEPLFSSNVVIENVVMDNILRNGVSIISGKNITVKNLYVNRVGLFGLDAEPDIATQFCDEIHITGYFGPGVGIGHHLTLNNNFTLEDFIIDGFRHGSVPAYTASLPFSRTGLNIRQSENVSVKNGTIRRTGGYGIAIGNTTTPFKRAVFENIKMDSVGYDVFYSFTKMIQQDNATSDSSLTFRNCYFNGNGVVDQVGFPSGSRVYDCTITGFDRLLLTSTGGHVFERCSILLNTGSNNDLVYDGFGGATFRNCYINCDYLVRGQQSDNKIFEFDGCDITYSAAAYGSMSLAPGTRFILNRNIINGSSFQSAGNGATIFHDKVLSTGISAGSVVVPDFLLHPKNTITLMNETSGRVMTIDPEGSTTVNGVVTSSSTSNIILNNTGTTWHFQADGVAGASNGLTLSGSTVIQGGRFTQNTSQSGRLLYSLSIDSLTNLNLRYNTNGALFSTNNGSVGFRIGGDVTSGSIFATDESFIATTAGGSGLWSGFGKLVIGSRINNSIVFTTDRTNPDLTLSTTEALFARRGSFENNIWVKNTGTYTNITNSFAPLVKENFTLSGRTWISSGGDVPLILGGSEAARPSLAITDNGGYIVTSGGGTAGTAFENYGSLVLGARYANPIFFMTSKLDNPKMRIGETGIQIGNGMTAARDSLDVVGTVRFEGLPAKTTETSAIFQNGLGQLSAGQIEPNDLAQQGATTGQVIKWNGTIWTPDTDTGGGGGANLTFSGATTPVTLVSDSGTDVDFVDGAGITIAGTSTTLTLNNNLITGVAGGQTVVGGTASGNSLTVSSTTNATKGDILFGTSAYKEATNRLGIGTTSPSATVHVTQAAIASVGSGSGTNATTLLTVTGTAGGATSANSGTVSGGTGGSSTITGGAGGAITGTPATGFGGAGGSVTLLGGTGGNGTTFGGTAGFVEIAGGTGGTGTTAGAAGYASMKGGNAGATGNGDGGNVFLVGGIPTGAGSPGHIYLGLSPSLTQRGNVKIGGSSPPTNLLTIGESGTKLGDIGLAGNTSGMVTIRPAAAAGTWTWTFPTDDGTPNQVLTTDGAGITSWSTPSAGGYTTIQEEGSGLTARSTLNFAGSTATAADDGTKTNVTFDNDVNALASTATTGLYAVTGSGTSSTRSITAGTGSITITNGDGVAGNPTINNTDPDQSITNELQTIANTSDATSHTGTLSNSGGSLQLVEGDNITLTTSGTSLNGVVTIATTGLQSTSLTNGSVWIGNASNVATAVALSGDATTTNAGVVTVDRIDNVGVTATGATNGQVLKSNGTIWQPGTDLDGPYTGSGTVPNGTTSTMTNDWTLSGTDNVGSTPALRVVMAGSSANKGLQTWRPSTGTDSLLLRVDAGNYALNAINKGLDLTSTGIVGISTSGASATLSPTTGTIGINAADRTDFTGTDLTFSTSSVGSTTAILQPHIVTAANITVNTTTSEIICVGQSGDITITFGFTPFSIIGGSHRIKITNSSPFKVTLVRTGSWNWMDTYGVATTSNKIIYSGQSVDLIWGDVGGTDYWLIKQVESVTTGVQEETTTTVTFDGRSPLLYIPSSATTTTINLPEIVASSPTATQVTVGAKFKISIDRAANVSIARAGASDVILAHNLAGSQTSVQTTGGTFFSQTFTAVGVNTWIID